MSGIVARRYGTNARPIRAAAADATMTPRMTSGPVQPRTPKATRASAKAMTSLVVGLRRR